MADYRIIFHNNTSSKVQIAEYDNLHKTVSRILVLESRKVAINNILYKFCIDMELQVKPKTYNSIFVITGNNASCTFEVGNLNNSGTYNIFLVDPAESNQVQTIDYDIEELELIVYEDNKIILEMIKTQKITNVKLQLYRIILIFALIFAITFLVVILCFTANYYL